MLFILRYGNLLIDYRPLIADDVAEAALYMLNQPPSVSIKALDVVPSGECYSITLFSIMLTVVAQRSLTVFDRTWNERVGK